MLVSGRVYMLSLVSRHPSRISNFHENGLDEFVVPGNRSSCGRHWVDEETSFPSCGSDYDL